MTEPESAHIIRIAKKGPDGKTIRQRISDERRAFLKMPANRRWRPDYEQLREDKEIARMEGR